MTPRFTRRFSVRHCEVNALGCVSNVPLVRYLQEAAIEASTALGFDPDWYREQGALWVVRRLAVRYLAPAGYGDEVEVATWISGMRGVRCNREYDLSRVGDGVRVARARAEWVYVDANTGQPTPCPDGWVEAFPAIGKVEDLGVRCAGVPTEGAHRYVNQRRVRWHELDAAEHVNHAVYLLWAEDAFYDALRAAGHPLQRRNQQGWEVRQAGYEVQYFAPAQAEESVEVVSWLGEVGEEYWAWTHEISHADTRRLLARVSSLLACVNLEGKPSEYRSQVVEDVVRGPAG